MKFSQGKVFLEMTITESNRIDVFAYSITPHQSFRGLQIPGYNPVNEYPLDMAEG